jgi:hypothetical protein
MNHALLLFVGFPLCLILFIPLVIYSVMVFARINGLPAETVTSAVEHLRLRLGGRRMAVILFLSGAIPALASLIWG